MQPPCVWGVANALGGAVAVVAHHKVLVSMLLCCLPGHLGHLLLLLTCFGAHQLPNASASLRCVRAPVWALTLFRGVVYFLNC